MDYFEVKPSFDPFHFLNDTSNLPNIIKSQLEMCLPLQDEHFKVISPYTLRKFRCEKNPTKNIRVYDSSYENSIITMEHMFALTIEENLQIEILIKKL